MKRTRSLEHAPKVLRRRCMGSVRTRRGGLTRHCVQAAGGTRGLARGTRRWRGRGSVKMAAVSVKSVAASVPFHDFCSLLERVSASRGTDKKKKLICTFLEQWRSAHRALHCSDTASAVSEAHQTRPCTAKRASTETHSKNCSLYS